MTDYTRSVLRVVVAQICQTIGWHSINSSPLEFLVDLMQEYFMRTYRLSHQYAEILGRTEVNLDDVGLAFQQMSIDINQLADYVRNVDPVPCAVPVPKYPLKLNENHLNFLKPGSREVVTRPVSIHDHLPAMYPEIEDLPDENTPDNSLNECEILSDNCSPIKQSMSLANDISSEGIFKRPGEPLSDSPNLKRLRMNDESRPLREIHSVMMTTSGFLSPAREGKLPEARTPIQVRPDTPPPPPPPAPAPKPSSPPLPPSSSSLLSQPPLATQSYVKSHVPPVQSVSASSSLGITQNSAINETTGLPQNFIIPPDVKIEKKSKKIIKKSLEDRKLDKENKKKNRDKDLFKPDKIITEPKVKKLSTTKDSSKLKNSKNNNIKGIGTSQSSSPIPPINISNKDDNPKIIKTIKEKKDKNITISDAKKHDDIVKLSSEPDKQKLNIFKKLTKTRDDNKSIDVIDNHKIKNENNTLSINNNIRADIEIKKEEKKVPRTPDINMHNDNDIVDLRSPSSDVYMFPPDMSPPGTPSTPKTPELNVPGPADIKKKKKETRGRKKAVFKSPVFNSSPQKGKIHHDMMETDYLGRPKTPEAPDTLTRKDMNVHPSLNFPYYPGGPGLIPHHIAPTMFPHFPIQPGPRGIPNFPTVMHNSATITPHFLQPPPPPPQLPPIKIENNLIPKINSELLINNVPGSTLHDHNLTSKNDTIKIEKISKTVKQEKITAMNNKPSTSKMDPYIPPDATVALVAEQPVENIKIEKIEKLDKKSKKHKLDKKEKLKKKKDKKDKHKEKSEKIKEKKEKLEKIKDKKEKKEKKKDKEEKEVETIPKLTLKLGPSSPVPSTSTATSDSPVIKKLTIKPLPKKPEDVKRESSPELARISALVTRPPKIKPPKIKKEPVVKKEEPRDRCIPLPPGYPEKRPQSSYFNSAGNEIWVCPACGKEDNGTVMIGCDSDRDVCNAWYHWACLRLPGEAQDRETWYCYYCIVEKRDIIPHDKKKKKKQEKR